MTSTVGATRPKNRSFGFFSRKPQLIALLGLLCLLATCSQNLTVQRFLGRLLLGDLRPSGRSVYLEVEVPWGSSEGHFQRFVKPLTRELSQLPGVSPILSATIGQRIVMAMVVAADHDAADVVTRARMMAGSVLDTPGQDVSAESSVRIMTKPISRPLRSVPPLSPAQRASLTEFDQLKFEFGQLFAGASARQSLYEKRGGLMGLFIPDLLIHIDGASSQGVKPQLFQVLEQFSSEIRGLREVESALVRNVAVRTVELAYDGLDLLRLGVTGQGLARGAGITGAASLSGKDRLPARLELAGLDLAVSGRSLRISDLLSSPVVVGGGQKPEELRLGDLVDVRPHYAVVSGELGLGLTAWRELPLGAADVQAFRNPSTVSQGGRTLGTERLGTIEVFARDERDVLLLRSRLMAIAERLERGSKSFFAEVAWGDPVSYQQKEIERIPTQLLLWLSFFLAAVALCMPYSLAGVAFARALGVSVSIFFFLVQLTGLTVRGEWLVTALGLLFLASLTAELPRATPASDSLVPRPTLQRAPVFLALLSVTVLVSAQVVGIRYSWFEKHHLVFFCLAAVAFFLSDFVTRRHVTNAYRPDEADLQPVSRWNAAFVPLYALLLAAGVLGTHLWSAPSTAPVMIGTLETGAAHHGSAPKPAQVVSRIEDWASQFRAAQDQLMFAVAASRLEPGIVLRRDQRADGVVRGDVMADILESQRPIVAQSVYYAEAAAEPFDSGDHGLGAKRVTPNLEDQNATEPLLVRLVDRHLKLHSLASDQGQDPSLGWLSQAMIPRHVLFPNRSGLDQASTAPSHLFPLGELLDIEVKPSMTLDVRLDGKPVVLLAARAEPLGPQASSALADEMHSGVLAFVKGLGLPPSAVDVVTSAWARRLEQSRSASMVWILALLVLGSGAVFFGSLRSAVHTMLSFVLACGIVGPILIFSYSFSGILGRVSYLEVQLGTFGIAVGLLAIWGHISADTNEARRTNRNVDLAFAPFLARSFDLFRILLGVWTLVLVIGLSFVTFRYVGCVLLSAACGILLLPRWVLFGVWADEWVHRIMLRARVAVLRSTVARYVLKDTDDLKPLR